MNLFGCIIGKRAKIEKTEKSAITSDSSLSAKICLMSAKRHLCPQSATASAKRHQKTSAKRHRCPESARCPLSATTKVRKAPLMSAKRPRRSVLLLLLLLLLALLSNFSSTWIFARILQYNLVGTQHASPSISMPFPFFLRLFFACGWLLPLCTGRRWTSRYRSSGEKPRYDAAQITMFTFRQASPLIS